MPEYIYILTNPSMPDLIKVGKTTKHPSSRMKELNSTGVPKPFKLQLSLIVEDCSLAEKHAHRILSKYRVNQKREFFKIPVKKAIEMVLTNIGSYQIDEVYHTYDIKELCDEINKRNAQILQEHLRVQREYELEKLNKINRIKKEIYIEEQKLEVISRLHQRPIKKEPSGISTFFSCCFFPLPFGWLVWMGAFGVFDAKTFYSGLFFISLLIIGYFFYEAEKKNDKEFFNQNSHFEEIDQRLYHLNEELKKHSSSN